MDRVTTKKRLADLDDSQRERRDLLTRAGKARRSHLYRAMIESLNGTISDEELDIHFTHMPARYWSRVTEEALRRHLMIVREFLLSLRQPETAGTTPVVRWFHQPDRGFTEVEVCTWDRLGLLAKVAGAFATTGLNIVRADIYTRVDDVVLDIFQVCDDRGQHVQDEAQLTKMTQLLESALLPGHDEGAVLPVGPQGPASRAATGVPPLVCIDPNGPAPYTVLQIEADDQIGLLYEIFAAVSECDVNVAHAIITTENRRAGDVLFLTDSEGQKITDTLRLNQLRQRVLARLS
jgi:[protein-PII] uridylyltransferase